MLLLSRRTGEQIVVKVGDEVIVVTVVSQKHGKTQLGFEASQSVKIWRREIVPSVSKRV